MSSHVRNPRPVRTGPLSPRLDARVIDDELVVCDELGRAQWDRLQARSAFWRRDRVAVAAAADPACVFAFDLLRLGGKTAARSRFSSARRRCTRCSPIPAGALRWHFADSSKALWQLAVQLELEGILAKDTRSPYTAGRSDRWLKIKTEIGEARERLRRGD